MKNKAVASCSESMKKLSDETTAMATALYWQIQKERDFLNDDVLSSADERIASEWNTAQYRSKSLIELDRALRTHIGEHKLYPLGVCP